MNTSDSVPTPSQVGNKMLAQFTNTDSLFMRGDTAPPPQKVVSIPLEKFQRLEQEIRHAPAVSEPYVELGQIYLQQERWTDARRILDAGLQYCPECEPIVLMREDLILIQAGHLIEQAKNAVAESPSDKTRYDLEQAEINLINERIKVCRDRYARHPDQKEILITWSVALRQIQKQDEAIEKLKEAATDLNLRSRASLQLGMCLQTMDRPLEALSAFRKAALYRSPPPDPKVAQTALELAAKLAEDLGLVDSAIFYLENLAAITPAARETLSKKIEALKPLLPTKPN